uniref:Uncharacterized protein n=1 Tax=Rhizophora mucronata TaxID=61149 RepID=A0A2P2KWW6_RHIMU
MLQVFHVRKKKINRKDKNCKMRRALIVKKKGHDRLTSTHENLLGGLQHALSVNAIIKQYINLQQLRPGSKSRWMETYRERE